jgi:hypothetical protein
METADKGDLSDITPYSCQTELMGLLEDWEEKALSVLKGAGFHKEQKQWYRHNQDPHRLCSVS